MYCVFINLVLDETWEYYSNKLDQQCFKQGFIWVWVVLILFQLLHKHAGLSFHSAFLSVPLLVISWSQDSCPTAGINPCSQCGDGAVSTASPEACYRILFENCLSRRIVTSHWPDRSHSHPKCQEDYENKNLTKRNKIVSVGLSHSWSVCTLTSMEKIRF